MPALTISTDNPVRSRSASPTRPPISPITPVLGPTRPPGEPPSGPAYTHLQPDQVGIVPPAPEPITFDSNPDVIALKSAMSILQMQRRKAMADVQALSRVKDEAVQDPESFMSDLAAGKVNSRGAGAVSGEPDTDGDGDDDDDGEGSSKQQATTPSRSWTTLPQPQNVVRCPPINWSQYAVVGESLDKLHAEQVTHPSQGTPAVIGAQGLYEFRGEGKQEEYGGIAAPYTPGRDKIDKTARVKK